MSRGRIRARRKRMVGKEDGLGVKRMNDYGKEDGRRSSLKEALG